MFIVLFRSFFAGLELNLHRDMLSQKPSQFRYFFYDFEIFKGISHNLELLRGALCNFQLWPFGPEKIKFLKLSQMNGLDK